MNGKRVPTRDARHIIKDLKKFLLGFEGSPPMQYDVRFGEQPLFLIEKYAHTISPGLNEYNDTLASWYFFCRNISPGMFSLTIASSFVRVILNPFWMLKCISSQTAFRISNQEVRLKLLIFQVITCWEKTQCSEEKPMGCKEDASPNPSDSFSHIHTTLILLCGWNAQPHHSIVLLIPRNLPKPVQPLIMVISYACELRPVSRIIQRLLSFAQHSPFRVDNC